MFGHHDDNSSQHDDHAAIPDESINNALSGEEHNDQPQHEETIAPEHAQTDQPAPASDDTPADNQPAQPSDNQDWQHPGVPIDSSPEPISDIIGPASTGSTVPAPPKNYPAPTPPPAASDSSSDDSSSDDADTHQLISLKQQALGELEPLVDQLDQSAEEHFRTLMMMIQANDDQSLIDKAYQAAHKIEDEKARAQALLDIVNEINYFTTQPES